MKEYTDIKRNPIFVTLKTVLFFAPIMIITNNIYIAIYGKYVITFDINDLNISSAIAFLIFCGLSFSTYWIETEFLPFILTMSNIKLNTDSKKFIAVQKFLKSYGNNLYKENPFDRIGKVQNMEHLKFKVCSDIMYFPLIVILWLIALNTILTYLLVVLIIVLIYYIGAGINSYFYKYNSNPSYPIE